MEREFPRQSIEGDRHSFQNDEVEVDVYKLVDLTQDSPVSEVAIEDISTTLDDECWSDSAGNKIRPIDVLQIVRNSGSVGQAIETHPTLAEHIKKIDMADINWPILVHGQEIIDGVHRLVKAKLDGQTIISAKLLPDIPNEAITKRFSVES